jgi:hypothetical protein
MLRTFTYSKLWLLLYLPKRFKAVGKIRRSKGVTENTVLRNVPRCLEKDQPVTLSLSLNHMYINHPAQPVKHQSTLLKVNWHRKCFTPIVDWCRCTSTTVNCYRRTFKITYSYRGRLTMLSWCRCTSTTVNCYRSNFSDGKLVPQPFLVDSWYWATVSMINWYRGTFSDGNFLRAGGGGGVTDGKLTRTCD